MKYPQWIETREAQERGGGTGGRPFGEKKRGQEKDMGADAERGGRG